METTKEEIADMINFFGHCYKMREADETKKYATKLISIVGLINKER